MNRRSLPALLLVLGLVAIPAWSQADDDKGFEKLFNGRNLSGFKFFPSDAKSTFNVDNGVIMVSGKPAGYFYTDKHYKNYVVKWEWRYKDKEAKADDPKMNSGCLLHITGDHKVWPKSVEIQGMHRDCGVILAVSNAVCKDVKNDKDAIKEARKPMGEWNAMETEVKDGKITSKLNGKVVATCTTELKNGPIGWQSEGVEIHFRNIAIKELKD